MGVTQLDHSGSTTKKNIFLCVPSLISAPKIVLYNKLAFEIILNSCERVFMVGGGVWGGGREGGVGGGGGGGVGALY